MAKAKLSAAPRGRHLDLAAALASTANARESIDAAAKHDEKNWTP
jgi:hypothetical protein